MLKQKSVKTKQVLKFFEGEFQKFKALGTPIFESNNEPINLRNKHQNVYFWPSLTDNEKDIIRDALHQIEKRTCLTFSVLEYKPWYHANRWETDKPYVLIRKNKAFTGYSDNIIEEINKRTILYLTDRALNYPVHNTSRGMTMNQIVRFMGLKEELLRPDSSIYVQPLNENNRQSPEFLSKQLEWPFDPESVTVPFDAFTNHQLTPECHARKNKNLGAGQKVGLLTRWDAVKINSMYCPTKIGYADPKKGPCTTARKMIKPILDSNLIQ